MSSFHDFSVTGIRGDACDLASFKGKACLVVNVASECGLTPQYDGLQRLYAEYRDQGLEVLGFPCNQFGAQEPGGDTEVAEFCESQFGVEFPMFSKLEVNGQGRDPLYAYLTEAKTQPAGPGDIAWNFEKFLVGKDGAVLARFAPPTEPCSEEVKQAVESALA